MHDATRLDTRHATWLFALTFLLYLSTAVGVLELGDDWSMLQVTRSIVEYGQVAVPETTPGSAPGVDGLYYSKYGLGQSLLAIPFYVAGIKLSSLTGIASVADGDRLGQATPLTYSVTLLGMLATALSVALFFLSARLMGFGPRASGFAALGLGLGTFAWYWALTFMTEPVSMLMLLVAFYAQLRDATRPAYAWLLLAGSALGFALLLRIGNLGVLPGFGLWLVWEVARTSGGIRRAVLRIASWLVPVMAGIAGFLAYNALRFGDVAELGYGPPAGHLAGKMWVGVYGLLFSPGRSMFLYAPILIAAAVGWIPLWRTRRRIAIAVALILVPFILLHARLPYWDGGGCWSPRYVASILPFLMLGFAALVDRVPSRAGWVALALVAILSVGVQILGIAVPCIPYASKMMETTSSYERLLWHAEYSPLTEHARSALARDQPLHFAPVFFQSTSLAWFQTAALLAGLTLLVVFFRSVAGEARASRSGARSSPAAR